VSFFALSILHKTIEIEGEENMSKRNLVSKKSENKNKGSSTFNYLIKHPAFHIYILSIVVIIGNIKGHYLQRVLKHVLPLSQELLDLTIYIFFGLLLILASIHFIRKYLIVSENIERTEKQFESVINNIKEVVFQTDGNGIWTYLNPAWTEVTGFSIEESLGKNFIDYIFPEDRERNIELSMPLIERKQDFCRHEIRYISKVRNYCWVEVFAQLRTDEEDNIIGTTGTLMDITQRKEMEQALIERERILQGVADATAILLRNVEIHKAFNKVLEVLGRATSADRVYIFQNSFDSLNQKHIVTQRYEWCNEGIEPQIDSPELQDVAYEDIGMMRWYNTLSSCNEICGDICEFPTGEREVLEPQGILTLAVVPIFVDEFFWGFIGFDDCSRNRVWSRSEITLLFTAAASIGGAIKRSEDENQIQELLRSDLKHTVQNLQNLVFKCKKDFENQIYFTLFEGRVAERIGLATDIVSGKNIVEVFLGKTAERIIDHFYNAFQGQVCNFEMQYEECVYYTSLSPIINNGEVIEVVGSSIDITDLKAAEEQIQYMAYYDTLTGLHNRAFFRKQLSYLISHANRNKETMAIMYLGLDRFKLINDTLGHIAGDELLKQAAGRLKLEVKDGDMLVRMGGDEFVIVFPEICIEGEISKKAQKIIEVFREPFNINCHELYISTSIGISLYPHDGVDMDTLIKNADTAMYRSKDNGSNNYQFYTDDMHKRAVERLELENSLRRSLVRNELFVVYQPRFNLKTEGIVGAEALLRWKHSTRGLISPTEFIPIAEETGLIHEIGKWVLYTACKQTQQWSDRVGADFHISVNISALQFQRADFVDLVKNVIIETNLNPGMLELEITENTIMQKTDIALNNIKELKEMGIEISIDDFGTGFSSLSYIKEFDSDNLKIDKSFIWDIGLSASNESIISAIISMAHSMGMAVIAEGVETKEQLEFLMNKSCDEVQGYLYSKPLEPMDFVSRFLLADEVCEVK